MFKRLRHVQDTLAWKTPRPAYACETSPSEQESASRHRDRTGGRPIQAPGDTYSSKKTRKNRKNSIHDRAGGRKTQQNSDTCDAKPTKKNPENWYPDRMKSYWILQTLDTWSSRPTKKHTVNSHPDRTLGRSSQPNSSLHSSMLKSRAWDQKPLRQRLMQPGAALSLPLTAQSVGESFIAAADKKRLEIAAAAVGDNIKSFCKHPGKTATHKVQFHAEPQWNEPHFCKIEGGK